MKKKMSDKKKYMAYILNQDPEFGYSQKKIGKLMDVKQSTIHNAIKDVKYEIEIRDLTRQLQDAREFITNTLEISPKSDIFYLD